MRVMLLSGLAFSSLAQAKDHHLLKDLNAEFGIELPVYLGGHAKFRINKNSYVRLGMGFASDFLLKSLEWSNVEIFKMKPESAELVIDSIANSLYTDIRLGYKLRPKEGLYAELGWSLMSLGKGETSSQVLEKAIGRAGLDASQEPSYEVQSTVHNVTAHLGYMFPLTKKAGLGAELGLIKPFYADVKVDYKKQLSAQEQESDAKQIQSLFLKKMWIPTGSLWAYFTF